MNKEEEIFLINIIKATISGEKHLGDKLKERCINYIEDLQQRIDKAIEYIETSKIETSYDDMQSWVEELDLDDDRCKDLLAILGGKE